VEGAERAAYMAAKFGDMSKIEETQAALMRLGKTVGLEFRFDLIERVPNTRRSHILIAHAARRGLASEVKERIMQAYFEEGSNIGDVEELVRLGCRGRARRARGSIRGGAARGQDGVVALGTPCGGARHYRRARIHFRSTVFGLRRAGDRDLHRGHRSGVEFAATREMTS